jgi:hypothetical protein
VRGGRRGGRFLARETRHGKGGGCARRGRLWVGGCARRGQLGVGGCARRGRLGVGGYARRGPLGVGGLCEARSARVGVCARRGQLRVAGGGSVRTRQSLGEREREQRESRGVNEGLGGGGLTRVLVWKMVYGKFFRKSFSYFYQSILRSTNKYFPLTLVLQRNKRL